MCLLLCVWYAHNTDTCAHMHIHTHRKWPRLSDSPPRPIFQVVGLNERKKLGFQNQSRPIWGWSHCHCRPYLIVIVSLTGRHSVHCLQQLIWYGGGATKSLIFNTVVFFTRKGYLEELLPQMAKKWNKLKNLNLDGSTWLVAVVPLTENGWDRSFMTVLENTNQAINNVRKTKSIIQRGSNFMKPKEVPWNPCLIFDFNKSSPSKVGLRNGKGINFWRHAWTFLRGWKK